MQSQQCSDVAEAKQEHWAGEETPLPMRPAPHPAGPGRAVGHSPSELLLLRPASKPTGPDRAVGHSPAAKAPKSANPRHSPSAGHGAGAGTHTEAVRMSPGVKPEDASKAAAAAVASAAAVTSSKKRKWGQSSVKDKALVAASRAASIAATEAEARTATMEPVKACAAEAWIAAPSTYASAAPVQPNVQQSSQGAKVFPPVQRPGSKGLAQDHSTRVSPTSISPGSSLPIIISDSDDDKPSPNPGPTPKQTCTPNHMPSPRAMKPLGGSSLKGTRAAAGGSHGSAESPIVIEISDDDDDIDDCQGTVAHAAAVAESAKKVTSSTAQHDNTRFSKAGNSKGAEGKACPSASKAAPQPVPFDPDSKGSDAFPPSSLGILPSPAGTLPASKQALIQGSTKHSPASSSPTSSQLADASEVQECVRQAARRSALLSVSRPGRAGAPPSPASDTITVSAGAPLCPRFTQLVMGMSKRQNSTCA